MTNPVSDLLIIGTGVAGLSAAITAAAEGLDVHAIGRDDGQIARSPRVENFPGFLTSPGGGQSGQALITTMRAQALDFGATLDYGTVIGVTRGVDTWVVVANMWSPDFHDGVPRAFTTKKVLVATGVAHATLDGLAPPAPDAELVAVIGGGNSAGQAALGYAAQGKRVMLFARHPLPETMSHYLRDRISQTKAIEVFTNVAVVGCESRGDTVCVETDDGKNHTVDGGMCCIGGKPDTDFLSPLIARDADGFIIRTHGKHTGVVPWAGGAMLEVGDTIERPIGRKATWPVYVAGDVVRGLPKRATVAMGDGVGAVLEMQGWI